MSNNFTDWANQYTGNKPSTVNPQYQNTPYPPQPNIRTNKIFVNGLQGALNMLAPSNSEMVYFEQDQTKQIMYVIRTDMYGMQSYTIFNYGIDKPVNSDAVTRDEFEELKAKVLSLEKCEVKDETSK